MKFKDYLKKLQKFAKENPDSLELPVIYSKDDEGNGFQLVNDQHVVMGMLIGDSDNYYSDFIYDTEDIEYMKEEGEIEEYKINAVIIN